MTPEPLAPSRGLNVLHLFCHPGADVDAGAVRKASTTRAPTGCRS